MFPLGIMSFPSEIRVEFHIHEELPVRLRSILSRS